jgi:Holliday junction resolvase RusA-like endonuclease
MNRINEWNFSVLGIPKAQPRIKAARGGGWRPIIYTPGTANEWKAEVSRAALQAMEGASLPIGTGVEVGLVFLMPRPKRLERRDTITLCDVPHLAKPDIDNLEKAVLDALKKAGIYVDDAQVFLVHK